MSTMAVIERAVPQFSSEELAALEQLVRKARRDKEQVRKPSLRDISPVSAGWILELLGTRAEWDHEVREGRG